MNEKRKFELEKKDSIENMSGDKNGRKDSLFSNRDGGT